MLQVNVKNNQDKYAMKNAISAAWTQEKRDKASEEALASAAREPSMSDHLNGCSLKDLEQTAAFAVEQLMASPDSVCIGPAGHTVPLREEFAAVKAGELGVHVCLTSISRLQPNIKVGWQTHATACRCLSFQYSSYVLTTPWPAVVVRVVTGAACQPLRPRNRLHPP